LKSFKFNLEKVLSLKLHNEELAKIDYAKILQKKVAKELENDACSGNIIRAETVSFSYMESKQQHVDYALIDMNDRYIQSLRKRIIENNNEIESFRPELEKKEMVFKECMRERKMLEKIKDKKYTEYLEECELEETEMLDEVSSNMFIRAWR
ncbi:MAG: flagellar export protein FliJ, partial [Spirochaetes bacterium RIFOXYB1_FULL_32_8]